MSTDPWARAARQLCARLEAPALAAYLDRRGGHAAHDAAPGAAHHAAHHASGDPAWDGALAAVLAGLLRTAAEERGLPADGVLPARAPAQTHRWELPADLRARPLDPALIGVAFENLLGRRPRREAGRWILGHADQRKRQGVFFTPPAMVRLLVHRTLRPLVEAARTPDDLLRLRLVDPALGAGFFLLDGLRYLSDAAVERAGGPGHLDPTAARRRVATACLHGFDVDPQARDIAAALLWLAVGDPHLSPEALTTRLRAGDALLDPALANLSGFDAVLSNPPWSKVGSAPVLAASGRYHAQRVTLGGRATGGDPDLYKYFMERAFHLARDRGRLGLVVPSAFGTTQGAAGLRQLYLSHGRFELLAGFENRDRHFPIHTMFRYSLAVFQKGPPGGIERLYCGLRRVEELSDRDDEPSASENEPSAPDDEPSAPETEPSAPDDEAPQLSLAWLRRTAGSLLAIPEVRTRAEADLFARLHGRFPPLGQTLDGPWNVRFVRELDMTNDRALFVEGPRRTGDPARYRPLYEGRMVHQFNHVAKAYKGGTGRRARWIPLPTDGPRPVQPHYWVETRAARQARGDASFHLPRAGYCDVTGHANERTVLAALIPAGAPCGNKVPTVRFEVPHPFAPPDPRLPLLWLAIANSFVVDWLLRRRISTTLNFFFWNQLPFPRPDPADPDEPVAQTLWTTAARLSHADEESTPWAADLAPLWPADEPPLCATPPLHRRTRATLRAALRADLDATVATLWGLDDADMRLLLADFPLLDRGQPAPITADLARWSLLRHQGQHHTPTARRLARRIAKAETAGAVAYVPSELALFEKKKALNT